MKHIFFVATAMLLFSSCDTPEPLPLEQFPCESDAIVISYAENQAQAVQEFGVKIFQELVEAESTKNKVVSPISIYSALLLAYEGSACETKKEIMRTLELGENNENVEVSSEYLSFMNNLMPSQGEVEFSNSNAFFTDPELLEVSSSYANGIGQNYEVESFDLSFSDPASVDVINGWAEENTNGKIKEVLEEISSEEVAFLLNAIYFKGDWLNGFAEEQTYDSSFTLSDGTQVTVPTMSKDAETNFFIGDNEKIVDLDIKGGEYAVSFIAPNDPSNLNQLISNPNFLDTYNTLLSALQPNRLFLKLPKFELEGKESLKEVLTIMGMSEAFTPSSADFSRMGESFLGNLFITKVLHDTYIKVDEKGIEGAAVTTVGVGVTSVPPSIAFDSPFIFILRHKETGVPIFIGKVENPISE